MLKQKAKEQPIDSILRKDLQLIDDTWEIPDLGCNSISIVAIASIASFTYSQEKSKCFTATSPHFKPIRRLIQD